MGCNYFYSTGKKKKKKIAKRKDEQFSDIVAGKLKKKVKKLIMKVMTAPKISPKHQGWN